MFSVSGLESVKQFFAELGSWVNNGSRATVDQASKEVAKSIGNAISQGQNASGSPLAPLRPSTLSGPIRRQDNSRIRSDLGSTPLNATGATAKSISSKKTASDTWEISSNSARGDTILSSNAKTRHKGDKPFTGDVNKAVRDPLQVSDKQIDAIEDQILKAIDRMLG